MSPSKPKVLFVLYGQHQTAKTVIKNRVQKLGYIRRDSVFTDLSYDKSTSHPVWDKNNKESGLIDITTLLDPDKKAEEIRKKFKPTFDAVLTLEVLPTSKLITLNDDDFREEVQHGIAVLNRHISEEERIKILMTRRKQLNQGN